MTTSVRAPSRLPRLDFARTDPPVRRAGSLVPSARVSPLFVAPAARSRTGSVFSHPLWRGGVGAGTQNGCGNRGVRRGADALLGRGVQRPAAGFRWSSSRHVMSRGAIPGWVFRAHSGRSLRPDPWGNSCYRPSGGDSPTGCVAVVIEAGQPGLDEGCQRVAKGYVPPWHRADASRIRCEVPAVVSDRRCAGRGLRRKVGQPAQKSLSSRVRAHLSVERMFCVPRSAAEPARAA